MENNFVVNIGRQQGSGGRQIGKLLSGRLDIPFYDKELITLAAKQSGLQEEVFERADEKSRYTLTGGLLGLKGPALDMGFSRNYLWNELLFKIQSDVIRELGYEKSCIFVGRCADYILRDHPRSLNLFISANLNDRIERVMENYKLTSEEKAIDQIERMDKRRAGYYNYYSNKKWGSAESYHLCINSSVLGIEGTVDFIEDLIKRKFLSE